MITPANGPPTNGTLLVSVTFDCTIISGLLVGSGDGANVVGSGVGASVGKALVGV